MGNFSKNKIYGILIHNRSSVFVKNRKPFSNLVFPDPSFLYYLENISIDRLCRDRGRIKIIQPAIAEIEDAVKPTLKKAALLEDTK
jgi:hypothetical protein